VIVPIPAEVVAKVGDPAYQAGIVPAKTYEGQNTDVPTAFVQNFLVTHEGVPADTVYKMTRGIYEHLDQLTAAHAAAKSIKRENALKGLPLPLHPGAEKYFREVGMIK
jgi:TRAP transporter TAXI family solute receptor